MNADDIQSYLSSIEEFVFDEKRIITCTWLAITLQIHVDLAKHLLSNFYNKNAKKEELSATYLLIGQSKNDNSVHIVVAKEEDLEDVEKKFKSITSKHVYSVQRSTSLSDLNMLYLAGKTDDVELISKGVSSIDFNYVERDSDLMDKLRISALPAMESKPSAFSKKTLNSNQQNKTKVPNAETKSQESCKKCTVSEEGKESEFKSSDKKIPSMFSKTAAATKKKPVEKTIAAKKPQGIGAFFSKAPAKQNNEPKKPVSSDGVIEVTTTKETSPSKENKAPLKNKSEEEKPSKEDACSEQPSTKPTKAQETAKPKPKPKKAETKRGNSKKENAKKKGNEGKQRKRLVVLSDSDSNQSSDEESKEEALRREPSPEPEPAPVAADDDSDDIICATPEPSVRKRKKKLVSKTFTGADGYMVTEKEVVVVSCSEDESEDINPEKKFKSDKLVDGGDKKTKEPSGKDENSSLKTTESPKENSSKLKGKKQQPKSTLQSPQKTKQASLMSFFKKK